MNNDYDLGMKWNDRLLIAFEKAEKARQIKKTDLAKACDANPASVTDWFNGKTKNIEARYLLPACKFLDVSPFWVMLGDEVDYDYSSVPDNLQIPAPDLLRIISEYAQTSDEGRKRILAVVEKTKKSFPRE
jgi:DNA-binding Xre family transcriptional regulator